MTGILWLLARRHVVRSLTTGGIVVVAVAFVVASITLSDSLRETVRTESTAKFAVADVYASGEEYLSDEAVDAVRGAPGVRAVAVDGTAMARSSVEVGSEVKVIPLAEDPDLRWQVLTAGRWPETNTEVASGDADDIGRTLRWLPSRDDAGSGRAQTVTVVGTVDLAPSEGKPRFVAPASTIRALEPTAGWEGLLVTGEGGTEDLARTVRDALAAVGVDSPQVVAPAEQAEREAATRLPGSDAAFSGQLLVILAGVVLLVAVMVISTTHGVVMSQRTRQLALLRCLGTSRGQLVVAGLSEALILGFAASVVGAAAGLGIAAAVVAVVSGYDWQLPTAQLAVTPATVAIGVTVGVLTTLVSSWAPVRRATRVTPVTALRPAELVPVSRRASRARLVIGILLAGGGAAVIALIAATTVEATGFEGAYAAIAVLISFIGVIVLARPLIGGALGWLDDRVGHRATPAAALGLAYARRNSHRSGALAASLLLVITLLTTATIGASTVWASVSQQVERPDVEILVERDALAGVTRGVAAVPGVDGVLAYTGTYGSIAPVADTARSEATFIAVIGEATVIGDAYPADAAVTPPAGTLLVSPEDATDRGLADGDRVQVNGDAAELELSVDVDPRAGDIPPQVHPDDLARLGDLSASIEVTLAPGTPEQQRRAVDAVVVALEAGDPTALLLPWALDAERFDRDFDTLQLVVGGLLGLSVLLTMLGLATTFALSVHERARDLALVRALGIDRREAGAIILTEAAVLGVATVAIGTVLGIGYALGTTMSLVGRDYFTVELPMVRLAVLAVLVVLAAMAAAGVPAYRSSRVVPAAGLTTFG